MWEEYYADLRVKIKTFEPEDIKPPKQQFKWVHNIMQFFSLKSLPFLFLFLLQLPLY
jgi:hypothetical protein